MMVAAPFCVLLLSVVACGDTLGTQEPTLEQLRSRLLHLQASNAKLMAEASFQEETLSKLTMQKSPAVRQLGEASSTPTLPLLKGCLNGTQLDCAAAGMVVALVSGKSGKICSSHNSGNGFRCASTSISWDELFVLETSNTTAGAPAGYPLSLKLLNGGKYCADEKANGVKCNRAAKAGWEAFSVSEDTSGNYISIRGGNGMKYCSGTDTSFVCNTDNNSAAETKFRLAKVMPFTTEFDASVKAQLTKNAKTRAEAWIVNKDLDWCKTKRPHTGSSLSQQTGADTDVNAVLSSGEAVKLATFFAQRNGITDIVTHGNVKSVQLCAAWAASCFPPPFLSAQGICGTAREIIGCAVDSCPGGNCVAQDFKAGCPGAPWEMPFA